MLSIVSYPRLWRISFSETEGKFVLALPLARRPLDLTSQLMKYQPTPHLPQANLVSFWLDTKYENCPHIRIAKSNHQAMEEIGFFFLPRLIHGYFGVI